MHDFWDKIFWGGDTVPTPYPSASYSKLLDPPLVIVFIVQVFAISFFHTLSKDPDTTSVATYCCECSVAL